MQFHLVDSLSIQRICRWLDELAQSNALYSYRTLMNQQQQTKNQRRSREHKNRIRTNSSEKMEDGKKRNRTMCVTKLRPISYAYAFCLLRPLFMWIRSRCALQLVRSLLECVLFVCAPCVLHIHFSARCRRERVCL